MSEERETIGKHVCASCGNPVTIKRNKRGHLYYMCSFGDDGCGANFQSRTNECDRHLLNKMEKKRVTVPAQPMPKVAETPTEPAEPKPEPSMFELLGGAS